MRFSALLIRLVLGVLTPFAAQADDVAEWLQKLQTAQSQRSYEGVVIYLHDGRVDQIHIVSRPGVDPFQRFASLSGSQREMLKSGGQIRSLEPSQAPVAWPAMAAPTMRLDSRKVARLYQLQMVGNDRVAGFAARMIEAAPMDALRYGQRLWIDQETGLLLGAALIGQRREVLEQVMFAQLAMEGGNSGASLPPAATVDTQGKVKLLPGFELIGGRIDSARGVEQRVYSDGLATVSVYIEQRQGNENGGEFATRRGAVQLYGRQTGATRVVAVGAVPPESTKRLVDATFESLVAAK